MEPTPTTGDEAAKSKLVRKIGLVCDRVVRGRRAVDRWQVKFHRSLRIASLILSSLGGTGLLAQRSNPGSAEGSGWAAIGSFVSLAAGIALQVSNELGIERIALEARSVAEAFSLVETSLEIVLVEDNPIDLVAKLLGESNALMQKYHWVVPKSSEELDEEAAKLAQELVQKYGPDWVLPVDRRKRRES